MAGRPCYPSAHILPPGYHPPDAARNHRTDLVASRVIEPFRQGEFDYLCGLYAAINAIRLARADRAELNYAETCQLFTSGIAFLAGRGLLQQATTWGMELDCRHDLAIHLAAAASDNRISLSVESADGADWSNIGDAFDWVKQSLTAQHPVLAYIDGKLGPTTLDHYSVISAISPKTITLFDSIGLRSLRKSSCGLDQGRYLLPAVGLLRIVAKPAD